MKLRAFVKSLRLAAFAPFLPMTWLSTKPELSPLPIPDWVYNFQDVEILGIPMVSPDEKGEWIRGFEAGLPRVHIAYLSFTSGTLYKIATAKHDWWSNVRDFPAPPYQKSDMYRPGRGWV